MDYEIIQDENHYSYVEQIIGLINTNTQTNSMNMFIEKIIKQPEEYQILCNALYWFIKGPPPIQQGVTEPVAEAPAAEAPAAETPAAMHDESNDKINYEIKNILSFLKNREQVSPPAAAAANTEYYQDKIIKTLEELKYKKSITIPHKNKLLIDQSFKQSNYKHYLSFYIINQQYI